MRFHDLRHTHVAMLISQGEHPKVIQTRLGHSSIKVTLDQYGHVFEGLDEAAARLDEVLAVQRADHPGSNGTRPSWPSTQNPLKPLVHKGFCGGAEGIRTPDPLTAR